MKINCILPNQLYCSNNNYSPTTWNNNQLSNNLSHKPTVATSSTTSQRSNRHLPYKVTEVNKVLWSKILCHFVCRFCTTGMLWQSMLHLWREHVNKVFFSSIFSTPLIKEKYKMSTLPVRPHVYHMDVFDSISTVVYSKPYAYLFE